MLGNKSWNEWIAEYSKSHQNPINRICHTIGIPMIVLSLLMLVAALFVSGLWKWAIILFSLGWIFQFVGHAIEGKKPEFFKDWRFLLVGLRWWIAKIKGQANSK